MYLSDAIRKRIFELMKSKKIKSIYALSILAGISSGAISNFLNGKTDLPKLDTLLHICEALDIELGDFFSNPLFFETYHEKAD